MGKTQQHNRITNQTMLRPQRSEFHSVIPAEVFREHDAQGRSIEHVKVLEHDKIQQNEVV